MTSYITIYMISQRLSVCPSAHRQDQRYLQKHAIHTNNFCFVCFVGKRALATLASVGARATTEQEQNDGPEATTADSRSWGRANQLVTLSQCKLYVS